ncbi:MAG: alpha/beta hydrolase [Anaerolineales bacterium]
MSAVILQDEIVHYEVLGRGRPIIFLHGWVGSWRYWIPTMQSASVAFRAYALDLWGFGDTSKNPLYYSMEHQVDLLDLFFQEMGIGKVALVGHGLGAVVALQYAARFHRLVDRLMVVALPERVDHLNGRLNSASPAELADWLLGHDTIHEAVRAEANKADPFAVHTSLAALSQIELERLPLNLTTPCLMVYGQNDPVVSSPPIEQGNTLPEHIHKVVFDGVGHFPMLDDSSKFNRLLADFLALSSGESPRQLQLKDEWKRRVR